MPSEKSILLVEDNPDDVRLTERALKKSALSLKLVVARDGRQALDYLFAPGREGRGGEGYPEVVLLDLKLPDMSGIEVLRRLRADPRTRVLPVVILTSSDSELDMARG